MFNKSGITTKEYVNVHQILADAQTFYSVGCVIKTTSSDPGVVTKDGRLIMEAGTPVQVNLEDLTADANSTTGTTANGLLMHDIDVTSGNSTNAACLLFGFVNLNRLSTAAQANITENVKTALNMVKFVKL